MIKTNKNIKHMRTRNGSIAGALPAAMSTGWELRRNRRTKKEFNHTVSKTLFVDVLGFFNPSTSLQPRVGKHVFAPQKIKLRGARARALACL